MSLIGRLVAGAVFSAAVTGCLVANSKAPDGTHTSTHDSRVTGSSIGSAGWPTPDHLLTPGAVQSTNPADICPHVNPVFEKHRPSTSTKNRVYAAYGITNHPTGKYEIDHLVPLELGGANTQDNLWPELNDRPGSNRKDTLENRMHTLVCSGKLNLVQAQHEIATDWVAAYHRYIR